MVRPNSASRPSTKITQAGIEWEDCNIPQSQETPLQIPDTTFANKPFNLSPNPPKEGVGLAS